jgi:PII-like signaling protein
MEQYQLLRIYFKQGQKSHNLSFWQRLWNSSLSDRLLKKAKNQNIYQANIFTANAGYLGHGNIVYNVSELPSKKNTICLELLDMEDRLRAFLEKNEADLQEAVSILLHSEVQKIK